MPRSWRGPTSSSSRSAAPPGCARPTTRSPASMRRARRVGGGRPRRRSARAADVRADRPRLGGAGAAGGGRGAARRAGRARSSTRPRPRRCCGRSRGAIRFDAPAAGNRPGPPRGLAAAGRAAPLRRRAAAAAVERGRARGGAVAARARARRAGAGRAAPGRRASATSPRSPTARTRQKKGLDRVLAAWRAARRQGETLVVAGLDGAGDDGVRYAGMLRAGRVPRAAAPRARVRHRAAARGLRDRAARGARGRLRARDQRRAGPVRGAAARARARSAAGRATTSRRALRVALDDPSPGYAERARAALAPLAPAAVDERVRERLLPALLERLALRGRVRRARRVDSELASLSDANSEFAPHEAARAAAPPSPRRSPRP